MNPGDKRGRLTLIREVSPNRFHRRKFRTGLFRCDCGKEKPMRIAEVINGRSMSCGCLGREIMRGRLNASFAECMARKRGRL